MQRWICPVPIYRGPKILRVPNGLSGRAYRLIWRRLPAHCARLNEQFDLSLSIRRRSNSKRMEESFDVQRDHVALMKRFPDLKRLPRKGGTIMFEIISADSGADLEGLAELGLSLAR